MFTLLIVDDEHIIRQGLRNAINWEEYGISIVGDVSTGIEAIAFIEAYNPDIVITDIKMPGLSGLELIKTIYESNSQIKFIVLSGYDDFEFVKESIKYDVENYLLKPVQEEELKETIEEVVKKIEKGLKSQYWSSQGQVVLKGNILNRLVANKISYSEFRDKSEILDVEIMSSEVQVAIIDIETKPYADIDTLKKIVNPVLCECENIIDPMDGLCFIDYKDRVVIIFKCEYHLKCREKIDSYIEHICIQVEKRMNILLRVYVGDQVDDFQLSYKSYNNALQVLGYDMVNYPRKKVIYYEDMIERRKSLAQNIEIDYKFIENNLKALNEGVLFEYIERIYKDLFNNEQSNIKLGCDIAIEITLLINKLIKTATGNPLKLYNNQNGELINISNMYNTRQLNEYLNGIIINAIDILRRVDIKQYSRVTKEILDFLNRNYNENISIKFLAQKMHFNPQYMGRIFRNETGKVFSDYLNDLRIKKSIELLETTSMKTTDIAKKVGFSNVNYFYLVFRKNTGLTPTQYRNLK